MKTKDVKVGGKYLCRVSGKLVIVKIEDHAMGRYHATNLSTGRAIYLRSARRLQGPA